MIDIFSLLIVVSLGAQWTIVPSYSLCKDVPRPCKYEPFGPATMPNMFWRKFYNNLLSTAMKNEIIYSNFFHRRAGSELMPHVRWAYAAWGCEVGAPYTRIYHTEISTLKWSRIKSRAFLFKIIVRKDLLYFKSRSTAPKYGPAFTSHPQLGHD
jgi:hypothetical protein